MVCWPFLPFDFDAPVAAGLLLLPLPPSESVLSVLCGLDGAAAADVLRALFAGVVASPSLSDE